jgi:hypothetical protein
MTEDTREARYAKAGIEASMSSTLGHFGVAPILAVADAEQAELRDRVRDLEGHRDYADGLLDWWVKTAHADRDALHDLRERVKALADEFAKREALTHDASDSYSEGQRDAWDLAEQDLRALTGEQQQKAFDDLRELDDELDRRAEACDQCGANNGEHGVVDGTLCPVLMEPAEQGDTVGWDWLGMPEPAEPRRPRRYDQCDDTCTTDCGHCKGAGKPAKEPESDMCPNCVTPWKCNGPHDTALPWPSNPVDPADGRTLTRSTDPTKCPQCGGRDIDGSHHFAGNRYLCGRGEGR